MARIGPFQALPPAYILEAYQRAVEGQTGGMVSITRDGRPYFTPNFINTIGYRTRLDISGAVQTVVQRGSKEVVDFATQLAGAFQAEMKDQSDVAAANREIASAMRSALRFSYGQNVERRKQVPSYPRANRLSGALRRAIESPDMVQSSATGIQYLNQDRLNTEARHWMRLNFGVRAAPGASRPPAQTPEAGQFRWRVEGPTDVPGGFPQVAATGPGRQIRVLQISGKPRPPMYMPPGFWFAPVREHEGIKGYVKRPPSYAHIGPSIGKKFGAHGGPLSREIEFSRRYKSKYEKGLGTERHIRYSVSNIRHSRQAFYPTRTGATIPTAGVVGTHFVDAGLKAFVDTFDPVYRAMMNTWLENAENERARGVRKIYADYRVKRPLIVAGGRLMGT